MPSTSARTIWSKRRERSFGNENLELCDTKTGLPETLVTLAPGPQMTSLVTPDVFQVRDTQVVMPNSNVRISYPNPEQARTNSTVKQAQCGVQCFSGLTV